MPTTPILGITQVSTSQNSKEATINDAILALENAGNATLSKSAAAGNVLLTASEATRNFIFEVTGATIARELQFPIAVNGNPLNRVVVVRNNSGFELTVKFATGAGTTVLIPDGEARLISAEAGTDMTVAAEAPSVIAFLSLTDVPGSYTGQSGKFLAVNVAENALEFIDGAVFPAYATNAGKYLVVNATEDGVEWVDPVVSFLGLTDTPNAYTGHAGKIVSVKMTEDGVEFIDAPEAEAVEFISAARWRIFVTEPGLEPQIGVGELEFLDVNLIDLTGSGTASASNEETGLEAAKAFDNDLTSGIGWLTEASYVGDVWLEYDFGTPVTVRRVKIHPITTFPDYTPTRFTIQYYNGTTWVDLGDRITETWVEATPQTFKVNGVPLTSVADAPSDGVPYLRRNADWEDAREWIRDVIGTAAAAGSGVTVSVNDVGDTITISADPEFIRDTIGTALVSGTGVTVTVNDGGDTITLSLNTSQLLQQVPYYLPLGFAATPTATETLLIHVFPCAVSFADDFSGSFSFVGVNPSASFTITLNKNGSPVGTLVVSTGGVVTMTTTGGALAFAAGDVLTAVGPGVADATIANFAATLVASRT